MLFIANIMSLAGHGSVNEETLVITISKIFLYSSLIYPIAYLVSLIGYLISTKNIFAYLLMFYLGIVILSFLGWMLLE